MQAPRPQDASRGLRALQPEPDGASPGKQLPQLQSATEAGIVDETGCHRDSAVPGAGVTGSLSALVLSAAFQNIFMN